MKNRIIFVIFVMWFTFSGVVIGFTIPSTFFNNSEVKNSNMYQKKKCCSCLKVKSVNQFHKKNKSFCSRCKSCLKIYRDEYYKTKNGLITRIFNKQKNKSIERGHLHPLYTRDELIYFALNSCLFNKLYNKWVSSGYKRGLVPSFDRYDDSKGYSFDNFNKWMTWDDNNKKANKDIRSGKLKRRGLPQKPVIGIDKYGDIIYDAHSIADASRISGVCANNISSCCNHKYKTAGGFIWKLKYL